MSPRRLTGTSWHSTTLRRKEGDARRHQSWCKYYQPGKRCDYYGNTCKGSSKCDAYVRLNEEQLKKRRLANKRNRKKKDPEEEVFWYD